MADSVLFSGAAARMEFTVGSANVDFGPITIAAVCRREDVSFWGTVVCNVSPFARIGFSDANEVFCGNGTTENFGGPANSSLDWQIIACTKPAGSTQPAYHVFDGSSWSHPAPGGVAVGDGSAATNWQVSESGGDAFQGHVLIFGVDDSEMSTGTIETLSDGLSAWIAAGFLEGVRLDAVSGLSTFTGGSMSQGTTVNATLATGEAPSWWTDADPPSTTVTPSYSRFPKQKLARV